MPSLSRASRANPRRALAVRPAPSRSESRPADALHPNASRTFPTLSAPVRAVPPRTLPSLSVPLLTFASPPVPWPSKPYGAVDSSVCQSAPSFATINAAAVIHGAQPFGNTFNTGAVFKNPNAATTTATIAVILPGVHVVVPEDGDEGVGGTDPSDDDAPAGCDGLGVCGGRLGTCGPVIGAYSEWMFAKEVTTREIVDALALHRGFQYGSTSPGTCN
jgi:hypothetical protein